MLKKLLIGISVLGVISLLLWLRLKPSTSSSSPVARSTPAAMVLPVQGYVVQKRKVENRVLSAGTLVASEEVELRSEISGVITKILFQEGTFVRKGTLLVKINDAELQAQLQRSLSRLKLATTREERQRKLLAEKAISQEEYDIAFNELNTLKAEVEIIRAQIDKTEIRAPFDGVVGLRYVSVGSYISPSTRIASIQNLRPLKIDFAIPEKYATMVRKGDKVLFNTQSVNRTLEGEVYAIEPKIDPNTRTLPIRAIYPNRDLHVLPGAFAEVELLMQQAEDAVMIPSEAVIAELKGQKVFVAKQGKAEPKPVEIGTRTDREVQVLSGLSDGDTVITTGILQLRPGTSVYFTDFQLGTDSD